MPSSDTYMHRVGDPLPSPPPAASSWGASGSFEIRENLPWASVGECLPNPWSNSRRGHVPWPTCCSLRGGGLPRGTGWSFSYDRTQCSFSPRRMGPCIQQDIQSQQKMNPQPILTWHLPQRYASQEMWALANSQKWLQEGPWPLPRGFPNASGSLALCSTALHYQGTISPHPSQYLRNKKSTFLAKRTQKSEK